jgi:hypothetical protein
MTLLEEMLARKSKQTVMSVILPEYMLDLATLKHAVWKVSVQSITSALELM